MRRLPTASGKSVVNDLRVLMIAPTPFFSDRGCHVRILEEIRALQTREIQVLLVTYPNGNDVEGVATERVGQWTGYTRPEAGPHAFKPFLDILLFFKTLGAARRFRPHLIHAHLHEGCLIGWFIARWRRIPLLFDYQGGFARELAHHGLVNQGKIGYSFFAAIESVINSLPDAVLPSSRIFCDEINKCSPNILPLQDALSPREFSATPDDKMRGQLNLASRFVVVFLGLLNAYQGVDLLLKAVKKLKERGRKEPLFLIMGYPDVERYQEVAAGAGVEDMVRFIGRVAYKDAAKWLKLGDAAVAPKIALTESNGKILDYMACGLPTVAFDTPVNRELLGDAGLLVSWDGNEENGATALADGIEKLAGDPELREDLSNRGRRRVEENFSREILANRLVEIYKDVLGRKNRSA